VATVKRACLLAVLLFAGCSGKLFYDDLFAWYYYTGSKLEQGENGWTVTLQRKIGFVEIPLGKDPKPDTRHDLSKLGPIRVAYNTDVVPQQQGTPYHVGFVVIDKFDGKSVSGSFQATRQPGEIEGSFKAESDDG